MEQQLLVTNKFSFIGIRCLSIKGKDFRIPCVIWLVLFINPLRPNNDLSQTSHCNIKGVSVSEVMRIENMITQAKFYLYFNSFSPLLI